MINSNQKDEEFNEQQQKSMKNKKEEEIKELNLNEESQKVKKEMEEGMQEINKEIGDIKEKIEKGKEETKKETQNMIKEIDKKLAKENEKEKDKKEENEKKEDTIDKYIEKKEEDLKKTKEEDERREEENKTRQKKENEQKEGGKEKQRKLSEEIEEVNEETKKEIQNMIKEVDESFTKENEKEKLNNNEEKEEDNKKEDEAENVLEKLSDKKSGGLGKIIQDLKTNKEKAQKKDKIKEDAKKKEKEQEDAKIKQEEADKKRKEKAEKKKKKEAEKKRKEEEKKNFEEKNKRKQEEEYNKKLEEYEKKLVEEYNEASKEHIKDFKGENEKEESHNNKLYKEYKQKLEEYKKKLENEKKYNKKLFNIERGIIDAIINKFFKYAQFLDSSKLTDKINDITFRIYDKNIKDENLYGDQSKKKIIKANNSLKNLRDRYNQFANKHIDKSGHSLESGDRLNAFLHAMFGNIYSTSNYNVFYDSILDKLIKDYTTEIKNYVKGGKYEVLKSLYDVFTNTRKRFRDAKHFNMNRIIEQVEVNDYVDTLKSVDKSEYLKLLPHKLNLELFKYRSMSERAAKSQAQKIIETEINNFKNNVIDDNDPKKNDDNTKEFIDEVINSLLEYRKYFQTHNINNSNILYNHIILNLKEGLNKLPDSLINKNEVQSYLNEQLKVELNYIDHNAIDYTDNDQIINRYITKDMKQLFTGDMTTPLFKAGRKDIENAGSDSLKFRHGELQLINKMKEVVSKREEKFKEISDRIDSLTELIKISDNYNSPNTEETKTKLKNSYVELLKQYQNRYKDNSNFETIESLEKEKERLEVDKKSILQSNNKFFELITAKIIEKDRKNHFIRGVAFNTNKFISLLCFLADTNTNLFANVDNKQGYNEGLLESYAQAFDYMVRKLKRSEKLVDLFKDDKDGVITTFIKDNPIARKGMIRSILRNNIKKSKDTSKFDWNVFNQDQATSILYDYVKIDNTVLADVAKDIVEQLNIVNKSSIWGGKNGDTNRYVYTAQILSGLLIYTLNNKDNSENITDKIVNYATAIASASDKTSAEMLLPTFFTDMYKHANDLEDEGEKTIVLNAILDAKRNILKSKNISSNLSNTLSKITLDNLYNFGFDHIFGSHDENNDENKIINFESFIEDYLSSSPDNQTKHTVFITQLLNNENGNIDYKNYEIINKAFENKLKNITPANKGNRSELLRKSVILLNQFLSRDLVNDKNEEIKNKKYADKISLVEKEFIDTFLNSDDNANLLSDTYLSDSMREILGSNIMDAYRTNDVVTIIEKEEEEQIKTILSEKQEQIKTIVPEVIMDSFSTKYVAMIKRQYDVSNNQNKNDATNKISDDFKRSIDLLLENVEQLKNDTIKENNISFICFSAASTIINNQCNTDMKKDLELLLYFSEKVSNKNLSLWFESLVNDIFIEGGKTDTADQNSVKRKFQLLTALIYSKPSLTASQRKEYLDILIKNINENELAQLSVFGKGEENDSSVIYNILSDNAKETFISHCESLGENIKKDGDKNIDENKVKEVLNTEILFSLYHQKTNSQNFNAFLLKHKPKNEVKFMNYIINNKTEQDQMKKISVALKVLNSIVLDNSSDKKDDKNSITLSLTNRSEAITELAKKLDDDGLQKLFAGLINNFNKRSSVNIGEKGEISAKQVIKSDIETIMDICTQHNREKILNPISHIICFNLFRDNLDNKIDNDNIEVFFKKYIDNVNKNGKSDTNVIKGFEDLFDIACKRISILNNIKIYKQHNNFTEFQEMEVDLMRIITKSLNNITDPDLYKNTVIALANTIKKQDITVENKKFLLTGVMYAVAEDKLIGKDSEIKRKSLEQSDQNFFNNILNEAFKDDNETKKEIKEFIKIMLSRTFSEKYIDRNGDLKGDLDSKDVKIYKNNLYTLCDIDGDEHFKKEHPQFERTKYFKNNYLEKNCFKKRYFKKRIVEKKEPVSTDRTLN